MTVDLSEYIAYLNRNMDSIAANFSNVDPVVTYIQTFLEQIRTYNTTTKIERRGVGSSFVLLDSSYGVLGIQSPQPYLGDSRPAFTSLVTTNPGSPFLDSGRSLVADWLVGSSTALTDFYMVYGNGTTPWSGPQTSLASQTGSLNVSMYGVQAGEGNKLGSFSVILPSCLLGGSSTTTGSIVLTSGVYFTTSQYMTFGSYLNAFGSVFTLECWVNPYQTNPTKDTVIFSKDPVFETYFLQNGGSTVFQMQTYATWRNVFTPPPVIGEWQHYAFVYDGQLMRTFYNGTLVGSLACSGDVATGTNPLQINRANFDPTRWMTGKVDEARISSNARYTSDFTPGSVELEVDANTRSLWHFNTGTGSILVDETNFAPGTLVGAAISGGYVYSGDVTITGSVNTNISEIGISGGHLLYRDTFPTVTLGTAGSELKMTSIFQIGS